MKHTGEQQVGTKLSDIEIKHVKRYEFAQKYCKDKALLDAACGCGYGSYILSQEANSVLGVDYLQEAIDYARKFWWAKNITFRQFDLNFDLTPLGTFDVIVSLETVEHLDTPIIQTCQKFYKILRPFGLLILSHPEKEKPPEKKTFSPQIKVMPLNYYIQKAIEHFQKKEFFIFKRFMLDWMNNIKNKIFKCKKEKVVTFHKHFNIGGKNVKNMMENIGFQIKTEWYQPGRPYHVIVGEKYEKVENNRG